MMLINLLTLPIQTTYYKLKRFTYIPVATAAAAYDAAAVIFMKINMQPYHRREDTM